VRLRGQIERIPAAPHLVMHDADGALLREQTWDDGFDHDHATTLLLDLIAGQPTADRSSPSDTASCTAAGTTTGRSASTTP
jgi:hypothetical protein